MDSQVFYYISGRIIINIYAGTNYRTLRRRIQVSEAIFKCRDMPNADLKGLQLAVWEQLTYLLRIKKATAVNRIQFFMVSSKLKQNLERAVLAKLL